MQRLKGALRKTVSALGFSPQRRKKNAELSRDMDELEFGPMYARYKPFTMTSAERMYSLYSAVKYLIEARIPGDFVECGVWRGGSAMVMAETARLFKDVNRKIYLYDTFTGMSEPGEKDIKMTLSLNTRRQWEKNQRDGYNEWCLATLDEVKENLQPIEYPKDNFVFVKGKVENTIPATMPEQIALLRLDTDWYESSYHELKHLFPRLARGGVLILDDYGSWAGAKEAVDQYFKEQGIHMLLNRIDFTGRIGIKA